MAQLATSIARKSPICSVRSQENAQILPTSTGTKEAVSVCGRISRHQKSKSRFMYYKSFLSKSYIVL